MITDKKIVRRSKRNKWEIYHDILTAINKEMAYGEVRVTRIQFQSNLSYDNLTTYLKDLESKQMINRNPFSLTQKGFQYFKNCTSVKDLAQKLGLDQI
jgi:predicted transcriptional regulator